MAVPLGNPQRIDVVQEKILLGILSNIPSEGVFIYLVVHLFFKDH